MWLVKVCLHRQWNCVVWCRLVSRGVVCRTPIRKKSYLCCATPNDTILLLSVNTPLARLHTLFPTNFLLHDFCYFFMKWNDCCVWWFVANQNDFSEFDSVVIMINIGRGPTHTVGPPPKFLCSNYDSTKFYEKWSK
jgi:hypothetical protein